MVREPRRRRGSDISQDFEGLLEHLGLEDIVDRGGEIGARCPKHPDPEAIPDNWSINTDRGCFRCWSCGYSGNLRELIMDMTGRDGIWEERKLLRAFNIELNSGQRRESTEDVGSVVNRLLDALRVQERYESFGPPPPRAMNARGLSEASAAPYGVRWDPEHGAWVLPVHDAAGHLEGWQIKVGRDVWTYPNGRVKTSRTLFGIRQLSEECDCAVLVESPLDVVRIHEMGWRFQAVSSFGSSVSDEQIRLIAYKCETLVIALDNDAAGRLGTEAIRQKCAKLFKSCAVLNYDGTDAKDPGEMTAEEFAKALDTAIHAVFWKDGVNWLEELKKAR